jgi:hypothetical protein
MKMMLTFLLCSSMGLNLWFLSKEHDQHDNVDAAVVNLALLRSEKGDTQSMLFLGLRAMLASAVTPRDDPREEKWARQAKDYILKVSAREDDAGFWILVRNSGFVAPDDQYKEGGRLIKSLSSGAADDQVAAAMLFFVDGPEEETFRQAVGLDLVETRKLLLQKAMRGASGRPVTSLRLASYLFSSDKNRNSTTVTQLVSDAITGLEQKGASRNPFAYEYLAELFTSGYGQIIQKDEAKASEYTELAKKALAESR